MIRYIYFHKINARIVEPFYYFKPLFFVKICYCNRLKR